MPASVGLAVGMSFEIERRKRMKSAVVETVWSPYPNSPQEMALKSEAFIVGFGGAGGGGKTDALLGLAALGHRKASIFRREYPQLDDMIDRSREILGRHADYNGQSRIWRGNWRGSDGKARDRTLQFAAVQRFDDLLRKWRGRTRDFLGIDEATEWSELMVRFLMGWVRSAHPDQRTRVMLTFNPPTSSEGMWVISFFAPWLDRTHPNPAKAGEIRWFARINDKDVEVPDATPLPQLKANGEQATTLKGEPLWIYPQSRTFIPALLEDNPILAATTYDQTLSNLPEPLRSQLRNGDFTAGIKDDDWQVIPTRWVEEAMERGRKQGRPRDDKGNLVPLSALGVDPSRGGAAQFAIAPRYDSYFGPLVTHQGVSTDDGDKGAGLVLEEWEQGAAINLDLTGIGTSVYDSLKRFRLEYEAQTQRVMPLNGINSAKSSKRRDKSGRYRLVNLRAVMWWTMREALDPQSGSKICLPDDPELKADLCAPRWKITTEGIQIEPKYTVPGGAPGVAARLGRSPDKGDAVVLAHYSAGGAVTGSAA